MIRYQRRAELTAKEMQDVFRDLRMAILEDNERKVQQLTDELKKLTEELEESI